MTREFAGTARIGALVFGAQVRADRVVAAILHIEDGETHIIASDETETYRAAIVDGTATIDGSLAIEGIDDIETRIEGDGEITGSGEVTIKS